MNDTRYGASKRLNEAMRTNDRWLVRIMVALAVMIGLGFGWVFYIAWSMT